MMIPPETRAMNKHNWGGFGIDWIDTTKLESYKQVEPRDGGKKPGLGRRTGSSLALWAKDRNYTSRELAFLTWP